MMEKKKAFLDSIQNIQPQDEDDVDVSEALRSEDCRRVVAGVSAFSQRLALFRKVEDDLNEDHLKNRRILINDFFEGNVSVLANVLLR